MRRLDSLGKPMDTHWIGCIACRSSYFIRNAGQCGFIHSPRFARFHIDQGVEMGERCIRLQASPSNCRCAQFSIAATRSLSRQLIQSHG
ncbi:hypothetical protein BI343_02310 [Chromobacterium amazonense]|nr:hypothetical protein BI343_02310 [Chromobacterium amazonense]